MNEYFLDKLTDEFTRTELLKLVVKSGYSISKGQSILDHGILSETIERTGRGKYRKVNNKYQQVK